ncbi:hypothetical protein Taro_042549 [Colocasia esculenta]|uniref:NADH dehydrogenase [ubiquinone] iron-sulfur protein 4, mitochondrial n=1 Tax=Colocasia esculenta TaxID=4460 RepID=A0A843WP87_COLES|nr:hypothetical protein [Colocasia esculenta]
MCRCPGPSMGTPLTTCRALTEVVAVEKPCTKRAHPVQQRRLLESLCCMRVLVIIYSPARTASQQGSGKVGRWKINFMSTQKWENPLMGWTSTGDPYANVGDAALSYDSAEAAAAFAENHGWDYVPKAYADNFKWKGPPKAAEE